ncbi:MAG: ATP-binding protein, partial [Bacteroidota bacterium]
TKHFLVLEQLRFKDKLHFEFDIAEDIQPRQIKVPALILQPYLENAIWHGIKPKTTPSTLLVKISKENKQLLCIIEDDGVGREAAAKQQANTLTLKKSVGMKITRERLLQFGGGKVEVVDLFDEEGKASGTRILLRIPLKKK